jgi:hypothetical protein
MSVGGNSCLGKIFFKKFSPNPFQKLSTKQEVGSIGRISAKTGLPAGKKRKGQHPSLLHLP